MELYYDYYMKRRLIFTYIIICFFKVDENRYKFGYFKLRGVLNNYLDSITVFLMMKKSKVPPDERHMMTLHT